MALGSYNTTRYNLGGAGAQTYNVSYSMYATMTAGFNIGALISPTYFCSQALDANMPLGWGYDETISASQSLTVTMTADAVPSPHYSMLQDLTVSAAASLSVYPTYSMAVAMTAEMALAELINSSYNFASSLTATANSFVAILPAWGVVYQALSAEFSIVPTAMTTMSFNVSIPAGGKLVINSDNFTVYLNNEDALYSYSGDWLKFARKLQGMDVTGGTSGDLDVSVLYTEQYL